MVVVGAWQGMGVLYYGSVAVAAALVCYQHNLVRTRERDACFKAFLNNNWVGCAIFFGIAADLQLGIGLR
jgi:4-hydroxybenzoate polyprenyltransferase